MTVMEDEETLATSAEDAAGHEKIISAITTMTKGPGRESIGLKQSASDAV